MNVLALSTISYRKLSRVVAVRPCLGLKGQLAANFYLFPKLYTILVYYVYTRFRGEGFSVLKKTTQFNEIFGDDAGKNPKLT